MTVRVGPARLNPDNNHPSVDRGFKSRSFG
jgi:hypothetical protein